MKEWRPKKMKKILLNRYCPVCGCDCWFFLSQLIGEGKDRRLYCLRCANEVKEQQAVAKMG